MPTAIRSLATVTATSRGPPVGQEPVKGKSSVPRASPRATARSDPRSMASIPLPRCILRRGPTRATLGKREGPDWDGVTPAAWRRALVLGEIVRMGGMQGGGMAGAGAGRGMGMPGGGMGGMPGGGMAGAGRGMGMPGGGMGGGLPMAGGMGGGFRGAPMGGVGGYPGGGMGGFRGAPMGGGFGGGFRGGFGGGLGGGVPRRRIRRRWGPRRRGRRPSLIRWMICVLTDIKRIQAGRLPSPDGWPVEASRRSTGRLSCRVAAYGRLSCRSAHG